MLHNSLIFLTFAPNSQYGRVSPREKIDPTFLHTVLPCHMRTAYSQTVGYQIVPATPWPGWPSSCKEKKITTNLQKNLEINKNVVKC